MSDIEEETVSENTSGTEEEAVSENTSNAQEQPTGDAEPAADAVTVNYSGGIITFPSIDKTIEWLDKGDTGTASSLTVILNSNVVYTGDTDWTLQKTIWLIPCGHQLDMGAHAIVSEASDKALYLADDADVQGGSLISSGTAIRVKGSGKANTNFAGNVTGNPALVREGGTVELYNGTFQSATEGGSVLKDTTDSGTLADWFLLSSYAYYDTNGQRIEIAETNSNTKELKQTVTASARRNYKLTQGNAEPEYFPSMVNLLLAITDETTSATIQMLEDVEAYDNYKLSGKTVTLDLNGKTWSRAGNFEVSDTANLTITDTSAGKTGVFDGKLYAGSFSGTGGLTVSSGSITNVYVKNCLKGSVKFTGGTIQEQLSITKEEETQISTASELLGENCCYFSGTDSNGEVVDGNTSALAGPITVGRKSVASVTTGGVTTKYQTLFEAAEAAYGKTADICLLSDVTIENLSYNNQIKLDGNIKLDLMGHRISATKKPTDGASVLVTGDRIPESKIVITDTGINGGVNSEGKIAVEARAGTLTINGGSFQAASSNSSGSTTAPVIARKGVEHKEEPLALNINGGTFTSTGGDGEYSVYASACTVKITGGEFQNAGLKLWFSTLEQEDFKTAVISGGTFGGIQNRTNNAAGIESESSQPLSSLMKPGCSLKKVSDSTWADMEASSIHEAVTVVQTPFHITTQPESEISLTYGETADIAVVTDVTEGVSYAWYLNGSETAVSGATDATFTTSDKLIAGTYQYQCKASKDGYQEKSNVVTVTVNRGECPAANVPTEGTVHDEEGTDTFTFRGKKDVDYEYSLDGGETFKDVTASMLTVSGEYVTGTIPVGNVAAAVGMVQVRACETAGFLASTVLYNTVAYTAVISGKVVRKGNVQEQASIMLKKNITEYTYTGERITPQVIVKNGKAVLKQNVDYILTYSNNINCGMDTYVTVTGMGQYDGSVKVPFAIAPRAFKKVTIAPVGNISYDVDSKAMEQAIKNQLCIMDGKRELVADRDYSVRYNWSENLTAAAGSEITLTFVGKGNYRVEGANKTMTCKVLAASAGGRDISTAVFERKDTKEFTYTGKAIKPAVKVKAATGEAKLRANKDYKIIYSNNVNAGTATVTLVGVGSCFGSKSITYTIKKKTLNKVSVKSIPNQSYTGEPIKSLNLTVKGGNTTLAEGEDYTVSYQNTDKLTNKRAGIVATAVITLNADTKNYILPSATVITKNFKIVKAKLNSKACQVVLPETGELTAENVVVNYNGNRLTPSTDNGKTGDYVITIKSGKKVKIKGIGNYTGTKTLS